MDAIVKFVLIGAIAFAAVGRAQGAPVPRRVISANLCADQLLLALADPDQIAALSKLASDPSLSPVAKEAARFPSTSGSGEALARRGGDLALIGAYDSPYARALLKETGTPVHTLSPWSSLTQGRAQIRELAQKLGHSDRGATLIASIDAALARAAGAARRPATFLMLHRRGYSPGARSVTSEIARAAGLRDLAPSLGLETGGFVSLERVVAAHPDYLIVSDLEATASDEGRALLLHPALLALYPPARRLVSSDPLTLCAGPATPMAIDALAAEIRAKVR